MRKPIRQGDVILKPITKVKGDKIEGTTLALGEQTGHHHTVYNGGQMFQYNQEKFLEINEEVAELRHQEHTVVKDGLIGKDGKPISFKGSYEIVIQEEYTPEGWAKTLD